MRKNIWKKTAAGLMALLIVAGTSPVIPVTKNAEKSAITAYADGAVTYIDANGVSQPIPANFTILTGSISNAVWTEGWYYVPAGAEVKIKTSDTTLPAVTARGDVKLVLGDGATLSISSERNHTYEGETGHSLTVYGQAQGTGKLLIQGTTNTTEDFSNENGSLTINGGSVSTSFRINSKNITLNGGALNTANHIHLPNDGTLTLAGGKVSPSNGYVFESGAKMTVKDGMVYVCRKTYSDEFEEYQGTLTADEIAEIKGKDFVSASKVILPANTANGSIETNKTLVLGSAEGDARKVTLNLTPDDGYHVARVTVNGDEITSETNEYTFTMPKTNAAVNVVFACSCTYLDEDGAAAVTDAIPLTGEETSLDAGTYVVNQSLTYNSGLVLNGNVKLILTNNTEMSINGGVTDHSNSGEYDISVYAQSTGDNAGKLTVKNQTGDAIRCKNYKQYGGNVTAETSGLGKDCIHAVGDLTISGGIVTVNAEEDSTTGLHAYENMAITGGKVTATVTGKFGFGIAALSGIDITGGTVTATALDEYSDAISSGEDITISGGKVTATATGENGYGINTGKKITLSLSGDDDFIKATNYSSDVDSISVEQGSTLYTTENALTGTLSAENINGKTLTKNDPCVSVSYVSENGETKTTRAIALTGTETELAAGTYVVNQNISYTNKLTLKGDVKLILADGYTCTMSGDAQINGNGYNLTVFGQTKGTGKLHSEISDTCIYDVKEYAQYGGTVDLKSTNGCAFWGGRSGTFKFAGGTMNAAAAVERGTNNKDVIFSKGSADITGGTLNISSIPYSGSEGSYGCGFSCVEDMNISGGNINVNMTNMNTVRSILCHAGNLNISGGTIDVKTKNTVNGYGLYSYSENGINISDGTVNVDITETTFGYGLYSFDGDINISDGIVNTHVTTTDNNSYGIWANNNDITITGGQITAAGNKAGITAKNISIGFSKDTDSLCASRYIIGDGGKIEVAEGQKITDGTNKYTGTLDTDEKAAIAGQTLKPVTHTVIWQNEDGTTLETDEKVLYGAAPSYDGDTPTKAADSQYTHTFSGWSDGTNTYAPGALPNVASNVTYTAQFDRTVKKYTVTWKNGDATLETDPEVPYGTMPEYNGATPTKAADSQYTYIFSGWDKEISNVTEDVTYTAQFTPHAKYVAPSYYSQTWTMTMKDYEYDGTAHEPEIEGTMYGYVTYTYYNTDTGKELDSAPSEIGNYKVVVYAEGGARHYGRTRIANYSITAPSAYTVTVKNGKISGKTSGKFTPNTVIAAKADAPKSGKRFGFWKKNGVTVSYNSTYTFKMAASNVELEAVYLDADDVFDLSGNCVENTVVIDKANRKITFSFLNTIPEGCTIVKAGIVATSDMTKANTLSVDNADYNRLKENITVHNYQYKWTKTNVQDGQAWYVKGYQIYKDKNGTEHIVYSNLQKATLNGYQTIHEDRIVGTALMDTVTCDKANAKLTFAAMMNVPADCTIKWAGVAATSDASKVDQLTKITATEKTMVNGCYVRGMTTTKHTVLYSWTKTQVTASETWYVVPYLIYTDPLGTERVVYGELTSAKLN